MYYILTFEKLGKNFDVIQLSIKYKTAVNIKKCLSKINTILKENITELTKYINIIFK